MGRVYIVWKLPPELGKLVRVVDGSRSAAVGVKVRFPYVTHYCGANRNT